MKEIAKAEQDKKENKKLEDVVAKITDYIKANKSNMDKIKPIIAKAKELGYDTVVIFGNPGNYICRGFVSCRKKNVRLGDGIYPTALLVRELLPGSLAGKNWRYLPSTAADCCNDLEAVAAFDADFPHKQKAWAPSQEEFYIYSHSSVVR